LGAIINVQVLEVATGEGDVSNNLDLAVTNGVDNDVLAKVADTALDLDAVVEELLEGRDIEDLVASGLRSVDDELYSDKLDFRAPKHPTALNRGFLWIAVTYLLGGLLGLATTGLFTGEKYELAYCSNMSSSPMAVAVDHGHTISTAG
jgi:hypothetical protein